MFLITLTYKKAIEEVDKHLIAHRAFLDEGYAKDYFIVSGPKNPRNGGIILSGLKNKAQLEALIKQDPFYIHGIAEFEITEFEPVKYHKHFAHFVNQ